MAAIPATRCVSRRSGRSSEPGCEVGTHPRDGQGFVCHQAHTLTGLPVLARRKTARNVHCRASKSARVAPKTCRVGPRPVPASWGRLARHRLRTWAHLVVGAVQLGRLSWRVDSGAALKTHLGAVEGALPAPGLMRMMLSDRVWSTSASSNWGTDEVHGLIWAAEVCWPADRRRPDSRRPWQSVASGSADDGTPCRWHASRRVWKLWAIGLPVCGAVEGVSDKIFATSMTPLLAARSRCCLATGLRVPKARPPPAAAPRRLTSAERPSKPYAWAHLHGRAATPGLPGVKATTTTPGSAC